MKNIVLIWARIKQNYQVNTFAFYFQFVASLVCSTILIYVYGNTLAYFDLIVGNNQFYRQFTVMHTLSRQIDLSVMDALLASWPFQDEWENPELILQARVETTDLDDSSNRFRTDSIPSVQAEWSDSIELESIFGANRFQSADLEADPPVIILPDGVALSESEEPFYRIGEVSYRVIGQHEGTDAFFITSEAFMRHYGAADFLHIRFPEIHNDLAKHAEIESYMQSYFPDAFIQPPFYSGLNPAETNVITAILGLLYALALFSLNHLNQYLFESQRALDQVYWIVGSSPRKLMMLRYLENIFTSLVSISLALILYKLMFNSVFERLNLAPDITYGFEDYIRIAFIMVSVSLLLTLWNQRVLKRKDRLTNRHL